MLRSKIISVTTVFLFVFGIVMIDCAVAGETMRWHGTGFRTDWKQIEVGDEELIFIARPLQTTMGPSRGVVVFG